MYFKRHSMLVPLDVDSRQHLLTLSEETPTSLAVGAMSSRHVVRVSVVIFDVSLVSNWARSAGKTRQGTHSFGPGLQLLHETAFDTQYNRAFRWYIEARAMGEG